MLQTVCSSLLLTSSVSLKHYSLVCAIKTAYLSRSLRFLLYRLASSILPPILEESQVSLWFLPTKEFTQIAVELAQIQNSSAECSACMFGVKTATSVWAFLVQGFVKYFSSFCSGVSYLDSWFLPASKFKIIWDRRDHFTYGKPIEKNKLLGWFFFSNRENDGKIFFFMLNSSWLLNNIKFFIRYAVRLIRFNYFW